MNRTIAAFCVLLACASAGRAQDTSSKQSATRTVAAFADTWNRHDMRAFGHLFSSDADFVNVTATWWKGRAAIEKNHAFLHGTINRTDTVAVTSIMQNFGIFGRTTLTFDSTEVRSVRPDFAVAHAAWHLTGDARTDAVRQGLLSFVLERNEGRWQIIVAQNTERSRPAGLSK